MEKPAGILAGNQLKCIAVTAMFLDHLGILIFPHIRLFRIIGRLAYPIFAYMIAEGCQCTRNKLRYFLTVFIVGAGCQLVYYFFSGDTYLNILLTFSASILLTYAMQASYEADTPGKRAMWSVVFAAGILAAIGLDMTLTIDYGFWGIMIPVLVSFARLHKFPRWAELLLLGMGLVLLGSVYDGVQHCALLSLPLILCYSGKRGKRKMKYFFYIFYPLHLALLQGIAMLVR